MDYRVQRDVTVPMRDGIVLAADVYVPEAGRPAYTTVQTVQVNAVLAPLEFKLAPRVVRGSYAEDRQGAFIVAAGFTVFLPSGTTIGVADKMVIDGETWLVSAVAADWRSPFTGVAGGVQVEINRITG